MQLVTAVYCSLLHPLPDIRLLQVVVVFLVVLDAFFVLAELLIDLTVIKLEHNHIIPEVRTPTSPLLLIALPLIHQRLDCLFADFPLPQLGSSHLFHGGAHGEVVRLPL